MVIKQNKTETCINDTAKNTVDFHSEEFKSNREIFEIGGGRAYFKALQQVPIIIKCKEPLLKDEAVDFIMTPFSCKE